MWSSFDQIEKILFFLINKLLNVIKSQLNLKKGYL